MTGKIAFCVMTASNFSQKEDSQPKAKRRKNRSGQNTKRKKDGQVNDVGNNIFKTIDIDIFF